MQHEHTEHVAAAPDAVFAALADVRNLPRYVPQMTGAQPTGDDKARRIEWSAESGYHGWMQVDADGDGSRLTLFLDTTHGAERDHDVAATLDAIRMLVEAQV